MKKFFVYSTSLALLALAACSPAATPNPKDLAGLYSLSVDGHMAPHLLKLEPDTDNSKAMISLQGDLIPGQGPDWNATPLPVELLADGSLRLTLGLDGGQEYATTVSPKGESLEGFAVLGEARRPVQLQKITGDQAEAIRELTARLESASASTGSLLGEYKLASKYAKDWSDPGTQSSYAVFKGATAFEGQVSLEFDGNGSTLVFRTAELGESFGLYDGAEAAADKIGKGFVIRWHQGPIVDERGETVQAKIAGEAFEFDRGRFADFGLDNARNAYDFLDSLQEIFRNKDYKTLSSIISFPFDINLPDGKGVVTVQGQDDLLANADDIFNGKVAAAVLKQKYSELFMNANGLMIGSGELWFGIEQGDTFTLLAVNPF